jgi:hypothetical protein
MIATTAVVGMLLCIMGKMDLGYDAPYNLISQIKFPCETILAINNFAILMCAIFLKTKH